MGNLFTIQHTRRGDALAPAIVAQTLISRAFHNARTHRPNLFDVALTLISRAFHNSRVNGAPRGVVALTLISRAFHNYNSC